MTDLRGKVAFITGAGRGQGRSHAVRMAELGADIIAVDICAPIDTVPYGMATADDLKTTAEAVEATGRRIVAAEADVRDLEGLQAAFDSGIAVLGGVDIVVANAGIAPLDDDYTRERAAQCVRDVIEVNLIGVWNTITVSFPHMVAQGRGGAIVLTSSTAGLKGICGGSPGGDAYAASKHGVVGLMRVYANVLAQHSIRVNTIHPTGVATEMLYNDATQAFLLKNSSIAGSLQNLLPVQQVESIDISNAIAWLVSDEARYVTGITMPVDAGFTAR